MKITLEQLKGLVKEIIDEKKTNTLNESKRMNKKIIKESWFLLALYGVYSEWLGMPAEDVMGAIQDVDKSNIKSKIMQFKKEGNYNYAAVLEKIVNKYGSVENSFKAFKSENNL
jgi:hypothetical protein